MLDNAEVITPTAKFQDGAFDGRGEAGETVDERRDASQGAACVAKIARHHAAVVVWERDDFLFAHEAGGKGRGTAAFRYQDEIHLRETGEVVEQGGSSKGAAAVQRIRGFGREYQDAHGFCPGRRLGKPRRMRVSIRSPHR